MTLSVGTETEVAPTRPARRIPFWAWPLALAGVLVALSAIRRMRARAGRRRAAADRA